MGATRAAQLRGLRYTSLVNRAGALHLASNCQTRSLASVSDAQEGGAPVEQPLKGVKVLELGK